MGIIKTIRDTPGQITDLLLTPLVKEEMEYRKKFFRTLKAKANKKRKPLEILADRLTTYLGSIAFLIFNCAWFLVWILINTDNFWGLVKPFDPFPFGFLTMVVSLEAIILSIIVLVSQNRAGKIDDLREEVDLQINVVAEQEITKIIKLLSLLLEKNGIDISEDSELKKMLKPTRWEEVARNLEKEVS